MFSGDSMANDNGDQFSTTDRDNDRSSWYFNCAGEFGRGGWWYNYCGESNLNGQYYDRPSAPDATGIWWGHWHGAGYSLKATTMMIQKT